MASYQIQFGGQALTGANSWDEEDSHRIVESVITRRDGVKTDIKPKKEARVINVTGVLGATSGENLRTSLATLLKILNGGEQQLQLLDDQYINAIKRSFNYTYWKNGKALEYQIQFLCADPYFYSTTSSSDTGNSVSADTTTDVSVVVGGNAPTFPVFTITPTSTSLGSVWIYNTYSTIDKWLKFETSTYKVPTTMTLQIDCSAKTCMRAGVNGLTYFSGEFFCLEGGATNILKVLADEAITLNVEWTNRWY